MLLRLLIKNFLSFDDEIQFDMFPNIKRTNLSEHIYTKENAIPLLKQAAIFGPNGSGKSNLVKAIDFIKSYALEKNYLKNLELSKFFYLLKENNTQEPIYIAIEFEISNKYFFYEIQVGLKSVIRETLFETFPFEQRMQLVFERMDCDMKYAENMTVDDAIKDATKSMLEKNPLSSVLALNREFPIIKDERCNTTYEWFDMQLEIIGVHSFIPKLIGILRADNEMLDFSKKLISKLDVGISDFIVEENDFEKWTKEHIELANLLPSNLDKMKSFSINQYNNPFLFVNIENGVRKIYQLIYKNIGKNGFVGNFDSESQSDGTLRALTLLPALYYASKKAKTVVIDEINFCLSPTMVKGIVEYFAKTNGTNGQLIFTTHDIQLLDEKDILRSDEIWFVDKIDGASTVYTHNDFKEHHTISTLRGYNEGRYGAIRFVNLLPQYNG